MGKASSTSGQSSGESEFYIFKTPLLAYTQRLGIPAPIYETIQEVSRNVPYFKSTVIVNNVRYDSLPGFSSRKASEHSAAEIALLELVKLWNKIGNDASPLYRSGSCRQLLEQYARKMKCALPSYVFRHDITSGSVASTCTVYIGGFQYTGAAARSIKVAENDAARVALLAIQSNTQVLEASDNTHMLMPSKTNMTNSHCTLDKTTDLDSKNVQGKLERKFPVDMFDQFKTFIAEQGACDAGDTSCSEVKDMGVSVANDYGLGAEDVGCDRNRQEQASETQAEDPRKLTLEMKQGDLTIKLDGKMVLSRERSSTSQGEAVALSFNGNSLGSPNLTISFEFQTENLLAFAAEINKVCMVGVEAPETMVSVSGTAAQAPFVQG